MGPGGAVRDRAAAEGWQVALAAAKIARPWNLDGTLAFGARVHCPVLCYPLVGLCLGSGFALSLVVYG